MEQSLFVQYITKFFKGIVLGVTTKLNDSKNALTYRYKQMLRTETSVTGKWESFLSDNTFVMADVVAMDSSLPLKMRDSLSKASGNIPKMGQERKLNETQLTELEVLTAQGQEGPILKRVFEDTPKVITAVYERNEAIFLEGLSTGQALIDDPENIGTGVRVDYGFKTENKFGVTALWSNSSTAKPFDDMNRVKKKAKADGNSIIRVMMDPTAFNNLVATNQAKELYAFKQGFLGEKVPTPSLDQINTVMSDRLGFTIEIVERSVKYERDGVRSAYDPWATGVAAFITEEIVGTLVTARLAEESHPVANVTYEKADGYILVSKYRQNRPSLAEFTSSQARCIPVISSEVYLLNSGEVQA
ncbi:hypothetical protein GCM10028806_28480 [Spirosoma terrae]|uniref:Major capsid protein n=1 Tax=Spirosoma terrae TaxID=1968276 RepID=A0A6L9LCU4_9BACT|nr:major capsid protein [Spirosoma terrae]NDU97192.1 hypothetical protein [Spirosoma terrae]